MVRAQDDGWSLGPSAHCLQVGWGDHKEGTDQSRCLKGSHEAAGACKKAVNSQSSFPPKYLPTDPKQHSD